MGNDKFGKLNFDMRNAVANNFFVGDLVRDVDSGDVGEVIEVHIVGEHFYRVRFDHPVEDKRVRFISSYSLAMVKRVEDRRLELDEDAVDSLNVLRKLVADRLGDAGYKVMMSEKVLFDEIAKIIENMDGGSN